MNKLEIGNILSITSIENELELEQASVLHRKLRWMVKEDPSLAPIRKHLGDLIEKYENEHWNDLDNVTDKKVEESDQAEKIVKLETEFTYRRKQEINNALKKYDLKQGELAKILGHSKGYMSELINGVRPFSQKDIVLIHWLLKIKLEVLIPIDIDLNTADQTAKLLNELNKRKLLKDLELA